MYTGAEVKEGGKHKIWGRRIIYAIDYLLSLESNYMLCVCVGGGITNLGGSRGNLYDY